VENIRKSTSKEKKLLCHGIESEREKRKEGWMEIKRKRKRKEAFHTESFLILFYIKRALLTR
jgi:hypothetical protein